MSPLRRSYSMVAAALLHLDEDRVKLLSGPNKARLSYILVFWWKLDD